MSMGLDVELNLDYVFRKLDQSINTKLKLLHMRTKNPSTLQRDEVYKSVVNSQLGLSLQTLVASDTDRLITMSAKKHVLNGNDELNGNVEVTDDNIESMVQLLTNEEDKSIDIWDKVVQAKELFKKEEPSKLLINQNGIEFQSKTVQNVVKNIKARLFVKVHPTFQLPSEIDPMQEDNEADDLEVGGGTISLMCPISQTMMSVPVKNGTCIHIYDQENIEAYTKNGNKECPECSAPLKDLKPDHIMAQRVNAKKLQDSWGWKEEDPTEDNEIVDQL